MTNCSWIETSTPEEQGIPSRAISDFLRTVWDQGQELHSLHVVRNGKLVAAGTAKPFTEDSYHRIFSAAKGIVAAAVLHNLTGFTLGYWVTRLLGRVLPFGEAEARTVAIEVGMQNSGMAAALSVSVVKSAAAALPANVFSIWMTFAGSVLASRWGRELKV